MGIRNIHLILAFLAFALMVLSSPINTNEDSIVESSGEEEVVDGLLVTDVADSDSDVEETTTNVPGGDILDDLEVCDTPECKEAAKRILENLNEDADPCEDFYEFACGSWMKNNEIPSDRSSIGTLSDMDHEITIKLREALEADYKANPELSEEDQKLDKLNFQKVKDLYNSCMDVETIKALGNKPILQLLDELKIDENKASYNTPEGLTNLLIKLDNQGVRSFFDSFVFTDVENTKIHALYVSQPDLGLPSSSYYEEAESKGIYKDAIKGMLTNVFADQKDRDIDALTEDIFEFEKKLSNISIPKNTLLSAYRALLEETIIVMSTPLHERTNVKGLQKDFPFIDWANYLEKRYNAFGEKNVFSEKSVVVDVTVSYFEKLNELLKETKPETIAAYAEWSVIRIFASYLSDDVKAPLKAYNKMFNGVGEQKRENYCLGVFDVHLNMAASKLFVQENFGGDSKAVGVSLIENVKESMYRRIPEIEWLDEPTKENALKKANALIHQIGYPDFIMNPKELYENYETLKVDGATFFQNIVNSKKFETGKNLKYFEKPIDKNNWELAPHIVNAYYDPSINQFVFLAGILQPPFFSSKFPYYLNYASIGFVIGHELTHAFDNSGKEFDYNGRLHNWWTNSTDAKFQELSQCFVDQYDQYYIVDKNGKKYYTSGTATLGENLGDNGGIARGYEAWKLSLEKDPLAKEHNKLLPGLTKYSLDQIFYIAFGQGWCTKTREELDLQRIQFNEHPLSKFRVNGVVSNSDHFAKSFNCPPKSPMNPEKKCKIW